MGHFVRDKAERLLEGNPVYHAELELEAELNKLMKVLERSDLEREIAEAEEEIGPFLAARDLWVIGGQGGERDENKLTDAIFYDRHPQWKGRGLKNAALPLRQEWIEIRDKVVRPYLKNYPAQPAAPPPPSAPAQPATAPPPAPAAAGEQFGFSQFSNIRKYQPTKYPFALAAQNGFQQVSAFMPYFTKIMIIASNVGISLSEHGDKLVFHLDGQLFGQAVESAELRGKVTEMMAHGSLDLIFDEHLIGLLGLGLTLLEVAEGIENERMLKGIGPEYDKWRETKKLQFAFSLVAEDVRRHNWGTIIFNSGDPRDIAVDLAVWHARFVPVHARYLEYWDLEHYLGLYQGNVPERIPPVMGPA